MKQVTGKDGVSKVVPLSQADLDIIAADELYEASRDLAAERRVAIDKAIADDPVLGYALEVMAELNGLTKGDVVSAMKAKV